MTFTSDLYFVRGSWVIFGRVRERNLFDMFIVKMSLIKLILLVVVLHINVHSHVGHCFQGIEFKISHD